MDRLISVSNILVCSLWRSSQPNSYLTFCAFTQVYFYLCLMVHSANNMHSNKDTDDDSFAYVLQTFADWKYYSFDDLRELMFGNNCINNNVCRLHVNCRTHIADIPAFLQNFYCLLWGYCSFRNMVKPNK